MSRGGGRVGLFLRNAFWGILGPLVSDPLVWSPGGMGREGLGILGNGAGEEGRGGPGLVPGHPECCQHLDGGRGQCRDPGVRL